MNPRHWPIERKFVVGTLAITLAAITLLSTILIASEQRIVRRNRAANTLAFAAMLANNAAASLVFDDEQTAAQILHGINVEPSLHAAALYRRDGTLYTSYVKPGLRDAVPSMATASGVVFSADHLDATTGVFNQGKRVGTAFLRVDLTATYGRFRIYNWTVLGCAIGAILLSFLLARTLQRWLNDPLLSLARTAKAIRLERNYKLRAEKKNSDEIGELVDEFNRMIAEVDSSQAKIEAHAQHLEREVADRTARLREMVNELETFSYSVSHDLRAPLRAIEGYANLLLDLPAASEGEMGNYLRRILSASTRMNRLITDILDYSRVAKAEMEIVVVDLDAVVRDVLASYPQLSAPGVEIEVRKPLGRALGHNAALSQVFSNLLSNAVKFVPAGRSPHISIWADIHEANRRICVHDNGSGIREEDLPRLFQLFERVGSGKVEGSGIGLSIVKKAVEKMNGIVGVSSTPGQGSTFWIELPNVSSN